MTNVCRGSLLSLLQYRRSDYWRISNNFEFFKIWKSPSLSCEASDVVTNFGRLSCSCYSTKLKKFKIVTHSKFTLKKTTSTVLNSDSQRNLQWVYRKNISFRVLALSLSMMALVSIIRKSFEFHRLQVTKPVIFLSELLVHCKVKKLFKEPYFSSRKGKKENNLNRDKKRKVTWKDGNWNVWFRIPEKSVASRE